MTRNGESSRPSYINRRDFLVLAAGGAAAAWYGLRPRPTREITGSIVGASRELGHRLRSGGLPQPEEVRDVPIVIAGGGIAGLSAGWKLHKSGLRDFQLLELEEEVGGNSRSGENSVGGYPWGAHYVPVPTNESFAVRELLEELGVIVDYQKGRPVCHPRYLCHDPHERLFTHGR